MTSVRGEPAAGWLALDIVDFCQVDPRPRSGLAPRDVAGDRREEPRERLTGREALKVEDERADDWGVCGERA